MLDDTSVERIKKESNMKKRIMLMGAAAIFAFQGFAYAGTGDITAGGELKVPTGMPAAGSSITKLSSNVVGKVISSANQFSAITKHINGTKNFATASTDTKIYSTEVASGNKGKTTFEITLANSDTSDFSSWTAL